MSEIDPRLKSFIKRYEPGRKDCIKIREESNPEEGYFMLTDGWFDPIEVVFASNRKPFVKREFDGPNQSWSLSEYMGKFYVDCVFKPEKNQSSYSSISFSNHPDSA